MSHVLTSADHAPLRHQSLSRLVTALPKPVYDPAHKPIYMRNLAGLFPLLPYLDLIRRELRRVDTDRGGNRYRVQFKTLDQTE